MGSPRIFEEPPRTSKAPRREIRLGMAIVVHHLEASRSTRVVWLLEELGVPYEIKRYLRNKATLLAPPELEQVHPLGKSPVITDDGVTVAESGAILEYLVEKYGKPGQLVPAPGTEAYRHYRYFMHYAEGSLMPYLVMKLVFARVKIAPMPFFVKPVARKIADGVSEKFVTPNLTRHLKFLGDHLAKHAFVTGDSLTVADMQMSYPIISAVERAQDLGIPASIVAYADKLKAQGGYQRALAKTGE